MSRPVDREEFKEAKFDIAEDKAPGPDGFSSGFYKAAWSVIGDEITGAVQDFFRTGKLLKQVNATILSLIPKLVATMEEVGDEPWIVLGDFNAVVDHSEVYGHSGDIQTAMGDFRALLIDTGLISLPSQGAFLTWSNCSDGPRSLWKKLDRMLVNDSWLARWPT
ncbi:UNVERIFIED_CONTAM: hypothetical protein Slati_0891800 [Sesamum latifolium]|uniref:Endonuclease/exonuclease/phosphatase domain-containing protein n=1 Tax=Sesamum latifolium TaxID=2727402 RepID=A0AAW2XP83_9LAMI